MAHTQRAARAGGAHLQHQSSITAAQALQLFVLEATEQPKEGLGLGAASLRALLHGAVVVQQGDQGWLHRWSLAAQVEHGCI